MPGRGRIFLVTGCTGLVGSRTLKLLVDHDPFAHAFVLIRDPDRFRERARAWRLPEPRVTPIVGDITRDNLGLSAETRATLADAVDTVVHTAADTVFSRPLAASRRVNTEGTARVLALAETCRHLERVVHVSTAFVAGRLVGHIAECDNRAAAGFVNSYEQSKFEAEAVVRASSTPWAIVRPSTIVADGQDGHVSQFNVVHRALRLYHTGLASMLPGSEATLVDLVTADEVASVVHAVATVTTLEARTFHACAGAGAMPLRQLLDDCYAVWSECPAWRRRAIARPAITDLDTYRLFERTVDETGDARLRTITRSLSHFVPQLALPKRFDTSNTERLTGRRPMAVREYWERVNRYLIASRWAADARRAA